MRINGFLAAAAAAVICCPVVVQAAPPDLGVKPRPAVQGDLASAATRQLVAKKREQFGEPEAIFGACCFENGECHVIGIVGCLLCGGEFQGFGTECEDVDCGDDQTQPVTFGACCFDDGSCIECLPFLCCILGGEYQGFGSSCDDACGGRGACCFESGACLVLSAEDCDEEGGEFQGPGSECISYDVTLLLGDLPLDGGESHTVDVVLDDNPAWIIGFSVSFLYDEPVSDGSWASDLRVILEGPNGFAYSVGGFDNVASSDVEWPFQGGSSNDPGLYEATFPLTGAEKGEWTITIVNDWAADTNPNEYNDFIFTFVKQALCAAPGACCLPTGACAFVTEDECGELGGVYQGEDVPCEAVCCPYVIDFETEDDFATPLVNGQDISTAPEFGNKIALHIVDDGGDNRGLAIFDSTPGGPNAGGGDEDLLVNSGNVLIIQDWFHPTQSVAGIFDEPNDSSNGGTFEILFEVGSHAISVDILDICNAPAERATVTLTDLDGFTRTYTVPRGWTSDTDGGIRTLSLETLDPQFSNDVAATAVEDEGFDAYRLRSIVVWFNSSGAIDNLTACNGYFPN